MSAVETRGAVVEQLGEFLAGGGTQTIGALVFWSLSSVRIPWADFRREMEAIGLKAAVPRERREAATLTIAVRQALLGKPNVIARKVGGGQWGLVFQRQEGSRLKLDHVATVKADPHPELVRRARELRPERETPELVWTVQGLAQHIPAAMELGAQVEQCYLECRRYMDTSDLSEILVNAMHGTTRESLLTAVSLRQTAGGLYFVHASKLPILRQMQEVIERLSPQSRISVLTITGEHGNLGEAAAAARQSFTMQLRALRDEVAEFRKNTPMAKRDERNISSRAQHYRALAGKVELFRDVLGDIATELESEIEGARGELERLLEIT